MFPSQPGDDEESRVLAERANQQKEQRINRGELQLHGLNTSRGSYHPEDQIDYIDEGDDGPEDGELTPTQTPTQTEPDEFTKVIFDVCIVFLFFSPPVSEKEQGMLGLIDASAH